MVEMDVRTGCKSRCQNEYGRYTLQWRTPRLICRLPFSNHESTRVCPSLTFLQEVVHQVLGRVPRLAVEHFIVEAQQVLLVQHLKHLGQTGNVLGLALPALAQPVQALFDDGAVVVLRLISVFPCFSAFQPVELTRCLTVLCRTQKKKAKR